MNEIHPYGDDWFSCDSCGGDFERFNQVEDRGLCEGCVTLRGLTKGSVMRQDKFMACVYLESKTLQRQVKVIALLPDVVKELRSRENPCSVKVLAKILEQAEDMIEAALSLLVDVDLVRCPSVGTYSWDGSK